VDGINYLIPANANIPDKDFLPERAISAQTVLAMLNRSKNALNIVVLDACRNFPAAWVRSADRGLAVMHPPSDSIIMYATAANSVAADGTGRNGLFTSHLLKHLKTPDIEVNDVFRNTMRDVARASNNGQRPAMYTDFAEVAYLGTRPVETVAVQPAPQPAPTPAPQSAPVTVTPAAMPERITPGEMVRINGGTFTIGSPASEPERGSNETQHQVAISSFYIGKYQVTQKEYQAVMGTNPSNFRGDNLPAERVSWYDALVYCNKLSMKEGLSPAYRINGSTDTAAWGTVPTDSNATWNAVVIVAGSNGYRLPTEAQWEYACRAGTATPFSTGNNLTTSQANYDGTEPYNNNAKGEYRKKTTPVGSFTPNAYGLYDMHGNVFEWCWDWYGGYASGAQTDPVGASSGSNRVRRGGSWGNFAQDVRSAYRNSNNPSTRGSSMGFRIIRPAQ
jgi:formylglycine-generating enzyme required for sulfatase activity